MAEEQQKLSGESLEVILPDEAAGRRLDQVLAELVADVSRTQIQELIKAGAVLVNGAPWPASAKPRGGERVTLEITTALKPSTLQPVAFPLSVVYEDEAVIVVDKPAGLTVHPGAGTGGQATLVQALLHHCGKELPGNAPERPGIVHRLDKDTTGLIVCAKTRPALASLSEQFRTKTAGRVYEALLDGVPKAPLVTIESYLRRDPNHRMRFASVAMEDYDRLAPATQAGHRFARSHFRRIANYAHVVGHVRVTLDTGRTHQIRVHAQVLGTPLLGDPVYGRKRDLPRNLPSAVRATLQALTRQMLHAAELSFDHPVSKRRMTLQASLPSDMQALVDELAALRVDE